MTGQASANISHQTYQTQRGRKTLGQLRKLVFKINIPSIKRGGTNEVSDGVCKKKITHLLITQEEETM